MSAELPQELSQMQVRVGVWSPLRQLVSRTPRPARRRWDRGKGKGRKTRQTAPSPPLVDIHLDYSQLEHLIATLDTGGQSQPDACGGDAGLRNSVGLYNSAPQSTPVPQSNVPQDSTPEDAVPQNTLLQSALPQNSVLWGNLPQGGVPQGVVTSESGVEEKLALQSHGTQLEPITPGASVSLPTVGSDNTAPQGIAPQHSERDQLCQRGTQPKNTPSQESELHHDPESVAGVIPRSELPNEDKSEEDAAQQSMATVEQQSGPDSQLPAPPSDSRGMDVIAGQLHALLDDPPWSPEENSVIDVHWLVGEGHLPGPSTLPSLTGALLRLRLWHNVELQIVTSRRGDCGEESSGEWFEVARGRVVGEDLWTHGLEDIWRGNLHFTEQRTSPKQVNRETLVFPGFSLSFRPQNLLPDDADSNAPPTLPHGNDVVTTPRNDIITSGSPILRDVGLPEGCAPPTHLEVVQLVDVSTVPLFWFSPFTCTLSLRNRSHKDSALLFPEIFNKKGGGMLVRLSYADEEDDDKSPPQRHRTTSEWNNHLQSLGEQDLNDCTSHPSPLCAYQSGPVLAVFPPREENEDYYCRACFLWTPDAISAVPFINLQRIKPQSVRSFKELRLKLPIVTLSEDGSTITMDGEYDLGDLTSSELLDEFRRNAPSHHPALDVEPSEWPEIKALATYELIQKKFVRRPTSPDLKMFGQTVAPPPSSSAGGKTCLNVEDVLHCFHDTGSPATSELSPIPNDGSDTAKVLDPSATGGVPSFDTVAARKKRYHGVNYCLEPEDSVRDARLTRIQQRYLLSERASNCSSSNTPEVKLEQRRRRRLRRGEIGANREAGGKEMVEGGAKYEGRMAGKKGEGRGDGRGGRKVEMGGEGGKEEVGGGGGRGRGRGRVGRRLVVDGGDEVERLVLTVREGEEDEENEESREGEREGVRGRGRKEGEGVKQSGSLKEAGDVSRGLVDPTTPNRGSSGIRLHKSPVVKLHKVETPPSTSRPVSLFSTLQPQGSATRTRGKHCHRDLRQEGQQHTERMETDSPSHSPSPLRNKSMLELSSAASAGDQPPTHGDILDTIDQLHIGVQLVATRDGGLADELCAEQQPMVRRSPRRKIELTLKKDPAAGTSSGAITVEKPSSGATTVEKTSSGATTVEKTSGGATTIEKTTSGATTVEKTSSGTTTSSGATTVEKTSSGPVVEEAYSKQLSSSAGASLTLPESGGLVSSDAGNSGEGLVSSGLRRSPRKNKWISGQGGKSTTSRHQSTSDKGKNHKKKLEQIVVGALKKQGMKRDHVCFRKCYTRLFNLSKSFLKDVKSSKDLVSEMHRIVDFNVSQVIDFELRQAHTTL